MKYYSQSNQDKWVNEFFRSKNAGYFVDVGAYDGIQTSNTYFFEKFLNWSGICIEANSTVFNKLVNNRNSKNIELAVTDYTGECNFSGFEVNKNGQLVKCDTLYNILKDNDCPKVIDYLSLDIEGYEYIVLKDFNFGEYHINTITVEHNLYSDGPDRKEKIYNLLSTKGFIRVVEDAPCLDNNPQWYNKPYEDWYVNSSII